MVSIFEVQIQTFLLLNQELNLNEKFFAGQWYKGNSCVSLEITSLLHKTIITKARQCRVCTRYFQNRVLEPFRMHWNIIIEDQDITTFLSPNHQICVEKKADFAWMQPLNCTIWPLGFSIDVPSNFSHSYAQPRKFLHMNVLHSPMKTIEFIRIVVKEYQCIFTRGQFWPAGIVVAWVRVCVCVYVNHLLDCAIAHDLFKRGSPNLIQRCKKPSLNSLLFCVAIDLDLQGLI